MIAENDKLFGMSCIYSILVPHYFVDLYKVRTGKKSIKHLLYLLLEILNHCAALPFSSDPQTLMSIVQGLYRLRPGMMGIHFI